MRRKWMLASLVGAAVLAGAAPATPITATAPVKPAAVVNGDAITRAEWEAALKQVGQDPARLTEDQRRIQQKAVLDILVDNLLLQQFLAKYAPPVSVADVNARVAAFEAKLKKANKTLADYLKETEQTEGTFRGDLAQMMRWENYAKAKVTDPDLKRYYQENKDFFDGVLVRVSHIELRLPTFATEAETEAEKARAIQQLTDLRTQLLAGNIDFAVTAKKMSQSPTAFDGGDMGYIPRKFVVAEAFAAAAFATPVNGISDVVQIGNDLHLIKVTERKAGTPSDFAKVKEDARKFCMEEMRMNLVSETPQNRENRNQPAVRDCSLLASGAASARRDVFRTAG